MICVPAGESTAAISSTTSTLADDDQLQPEAALKNQRSKALYQNVYHDTDVTYDLDSNRLKESLLLRSCPKEMLGYRYRLESDSLRLELKRTTVFWPMPKTPVPKMNRYSICRLRICWMQKTHTPMISK